MDEEKEPSPESLAVASDEGVAQDEQLSPAGQQIERLIRIAKRPEFIPRFLDAASKQDTSKARYWLARCMGRNA